MAIKIRVLQHKKKDLGGKWYGKAVSTGEVSTGELAKSISLSNSVTEGDVLAVIKALTEEMRRQMQMGKTVVLDDFGRFHLSVKSDMVDRKGDYNIKKHVKKVVCRFTPTGHRDQLDRHLVRPFCDGTEVERVKE